MILIEKILGSARDPEWTSRLAAGTVDRLALDHWEAQKNRFRKKTASGVDIAVSLDRGTFLRDGDVLVWDEAAARAVVATITLRDVMIIHLDGLALQPSGIATRTCLELGHALGNQHWPALVKGNLAMLYMLNPMDGVINGFRWAIAGGRQSLDAAVPPLALDGNSVLVSIAVVAVIMTLGLRYFRRTEKRFADII